MRKRIYFLFIICLFCWNGCQSKKDNADKETKYNGSFSVVPDDDKIALIIDSVSVSSTYRIYLSIVNHLDEEVYVGNKYQLEYYNDMSDRWENALPPNTVHLLSSRIILPYDTVRQEIDIKPKQREGTFRITKSAEYTFNGKIVEIVLVGEMTIDSERGKYVYP